jgi:hypothetical protein
MPRDSLALKRIADAVVSQHSPEDLRFAIDNAKLWASEPDLLTLMKKGFQARGSTEEEANAFIRSVISMAGFSLH